MKCSDFSIAINAIQFGLDSLLPSFSFSIYHCNFACLDRHIAMRLFRGKQNIQYESNVILFV